MKKITIALLTFVLALSFSSCKKDENLASTPVPEEKPVAEEPKIKRTIDISSGISGDGHSFSYEADMNYDDAKEKITIETVTYNTGDQDLEVDIGGEKIRMEIWDGSIVKVYDCDLDTKDKLRDLAIITEEESGDPRIRIISYSETEYLYCQKFLEDSSYYEESERTVNQDNWMGYACTYYFNVNDDDTLTIEEQTNSVGMWSVYKRYAKNSDGVYEEVRPDKYEILPDFMKGMEEWGEFVSEEEKALWKKGYVMARLSFKNDNIVITAGEAFKPLYDDGNNILYIQKENGEKGTIDISYDNFGDRYEFNPLFFFLAG